MSLPGNGKRLATILGFAALQSVLAVASISLNEMGRFAVTGHHEIFFNYASQAMSGHVPYRDFLVEYPLLSFALMLGPRLVASTLAGYSAVFVAMLLGFNLATLVLVALRVEQTEGFVRVPVALGWYTLFFVALCPLALGPFDLAPTFLAFFAACAWASGQNGRGGIFAGLGVLMKVFPGAVALPGLILEASRIRQSRVRGTFAFVLTVALGLGVWFAIAGRGLVDSLVYQTERGLQVESTWAGLVFLQGVLTGHPVAWTLDHSSAHVASDRGAWLVSLALPTQFLIFAVVAWRFARSGRADLPRYAAAAILGFIVGGKVLSPQFMIWLIPFLSVLQGPNALRSRRVFLACCLMSSLSFPWGVLLFLLNGYRWAVLFLNVRNALLIYLLVLLLFEPRKPLQGVSTDA